MLVSEHIEPSWHRALAAAGLKPLEQHFAPRDKQEALLHLLYGKFTVDSDISPILLHKPGWLSQLADAPVSISHTNNSPVDALPWLDNAQPSAFAIVFDNTPLAHWAQYQQFDNIVLLSLTGSHNQFNLAPAQAWSNWGALRQLQTHQVTQHLDWLPTLLAQAGCKSDARWLGDNLKKPSRLPKLTISGQEIISFKKDKMVILRADGSYGVWSAGTLVTLNEKLDLPMLTDALKRIEPIKD